MTSTSPAMEAGIDIAALAAEYLDLKERGDVIAARIKNIQAALRTLSAGRHAAGDFTVTVTPARRFNAEQARQILANTPDLLAACTEEVVTPSRAKQVLPPALYELCMTESGDPRITIK